MVSAAEYCYRRYPTIVNALKESGITYRNTKADYAAMDNKFAKSQMGIGYSSNLAQLAMSYYWTELQKPEPDERRLKELYDNFVILSVLAQVLIDSCKREYEIDGNTEIKRIANLECMQLTKSYVTKAGKVKTYKCDFPEFMKYTREVKVTKDGKEIPYDEVNESKDKLKRRINRDLVCPMNDLEYWLDKIQGASTTATIPTEKFFIKMKGQANARQMTKIMDFIVSYENFIIDSRIKYKDDNEMYVQSIATKSAEIVSELKNIRIGNIVTINRLIEIALGLSNEVGVSKSREYSPEKHTRKILSMLYKMNPEKFLVNFVCQS